MPGGNRGVIEPELLERSGSEVFDEHIRLGNQIVEDRAAGRMFEIEGDAFLVAVDAQEVRALAWVSGVAIARSLRTGVQKGWSPGPRVVAFARLLDFNDPRAHVGEQHRAVRTRQDTREIEN